MKGIEILTTETIEHPFWDVDVFIVLCFILAVIWLIIFSIKNLFKDYFIPKYKHYNIKFNDSNAPLFALGVFVGIVMVFACCFTLREYYKECQPEERYLIKITEDANFLEFNNKYEILEDKGNNVFIVREKGN